jgi:hypothetical protein
MNKIAKLALASSAAALFSSAVVTPVYAGDEGADASVICAGANACKGLGTCKTATNACSGKNACKGQGWIRTLSSEECAEKGGTVLDSISEVRSATK